VDGNHIWSEGFISQDQFGVVESTGVAMDDAGNVIFTGSFNPSTDLGSGTITKVNQYGDNFLAKYNSSGNYVWSNHFVDGSPMDNARTNDVAVDSSGNVVAVGVFKGPLAIDGVVPPDLQGINFKQIFVSKFAP
jgi:hypothetical protein